MKMGTKFVVKFDGHKQYVRCVGFGRYICPFGVRKTFWTDLKIKFLC